MDNSINAWQEQVACRAASQTCKTSMEKSKTYSYQDLLDGYELTDYFYTEQDYYE